MLTCEEVTIQCPMEVSAYLSERLWGLESVLSVMEDYKDESLLAIKAILKEPSDIQAAIEDLQRLIAEDDLLREARCQVSTHRTIVEEDWAESWKQHWHVQQITDRLTIRPSWEPYTSQSPDEIVLDLDPGGAFGTGTHETTRLMLVALEKLSIEQPFSSISLLDVGTGSGILAICAARLGCRNVTALDNDPAAVQAARENAELNRVADAVTVLETPLDQMCRTRYDVIVANIIAPVILELMPEMVCRMNPGGVFLASGLIATSVGQVEAAMNEAGFTQIERSQQGDWFGLYGRYQP